MIVAVSPDQQKCFPVLAINGGTRPDFAPLKKYIEKLFDEVDFPQLWARQMFDMGQAMRAATLFIEGKTEYALANFHQIVVDTAQALARVISYSPFDDEFSLVLNREIKTPKLAPMNEVIAIYCCMFFLGSLVRYRPQLLEAMLSTKDAWLIERFIKSAPITFLRHVRNLFDDQYLVFKQR